MTNHICILNMLDSFENICSNIENIVYYMYVVYSTIFILFVQSNTLLYLQFMKINLLAFKSIF